MRYYPTVVECSFKCSNFFFFFLNMYKNWGLQQNAWHSVNIIELRLRTLLWH